MNVQSCLAGQDITPADMESVLDALADGVLILAPDCRVVFINDAACAILGVDRSQATQLGWEGLRKHPLALDVSPLPASMAELCKLDSLEMQLAGDITNKKVVCRVRPICRPDGRQRLVVLVFAETRQAREPLREEQRNGATGRAGAVAAVTQQPPGSERRVMREASPHEQRELLCRTLEATGWNVAKAARRLKLSRTTLYARIARYGLVRPEE